MSGDEATATGEKHFSHCVCIQGTSTVRNICGVGCTLERVRGGRLYTPRGSTLTNAACIQVPFLEPPSIRLGLIIKVSPVGAHDLQGPMVLLELYAW